MAVTPEFEWGGFAEGQLSCGLDAHANVESLLASESLAEQHEASACLREVSFVLRELSQSSAACHEGDVNFGVFADEFHLPREGGFELGRDRCVGIDAGDLEFVSPLVGKGWVPHPQVARPTGFVQHLDVDGLRLGQASLVGDVHAEPNMLLAVEIVGGKAHAVMGDIPRFFEVQIVVIAWPSAERFLSNRVEDFRAWLAVIGSDARERVVDRGGALVVRERFENFKLSRAEFFRGQRGDRGAVALEVFVEPVERRDAEFLRVGVATGRDGLA